MRLSIALCTYNGERFLQDQLESFVAQTQLPDEIVICDDCSTDRTAEIIRSFAKTAPFPVRFFENESNLGYIKNFERSIALCGGDIIFLADQDDVWVVNKLEKFAAEFSSDEKVGMVFCNGELVDENLAPLASDAWEVRLLNEKKRKKIREGNGFPIILKDNVVSGCMMAFRAEYRNILLPIPTDIHNVIHDYWIALLMTVITKVKPLSEKLVKYRQHNQQQIGLSPTDKTVKTFYEKAVEKHDFPGQKRKYEDLKKKLNERFKSNSKNYQINQEKLFRELDRQLQHAQARFQINENKNFSIAVIAKELISGRYHDYSNGWRSAIKDLSVYFFR